ncbi:hypothetical protein F8M41_013008 [Gigaspora margarita]|uniref:Uncharacterized protein n=1 Tax=Gigaspora margarita TaxID=4874 RepID=A0A8H4EPD1_GIGMA|nr:hypothetical protein F8M41_013008 [Gigaspora margarita]
MSTNDNKELQTELEITGGIITFTIIIIGEYFNAVVPISVPDHFVTIIVSATASTVTTTITASNTNSIETTTTNLPQYFHDINVQETLGGLLFFLITISITACIIYNRKKAYRNKLVKHDLDKENEDIAKQSEVSVQFNHESTTRTNLSHCHK